ncbi:MAG TPA: SUF system Fe-S cluster assembly protein [Vicinamibacterales bacterium]|nr:SUF system Fe-S cluster assembly protein [Vicinamibacterales bacterium]
MKPLPVIQPPSPTASASPAVGGAQPGQPLQTDGLVTDPARSAALMPPIVKALSKVFDPEIPVNIYDLGLIYEVIVDASSHVGIRMTLTAPACPAAQFLPGQVKDAVASVPGVSDVKVDVVWDPPWTRDRMSDAAKLDLGLF